MDGLNPDRSLNLSMIDETNKSFSWLEGSLGSAQIPFFHAGVYSSLLVLFYVMKIRQIKPARNKIVSISLTFKQFLERSFYCSQKLLNNKSLAIRTSSYYNPELLNVNGTQFMNSVSISVLIIT
eukprot:TRINITY_DN2468_c0_g1_i1.p3 TRINITY_DN2468_c0_g1~~TRINITY_DN2468_c0_g1_i1.p3  ORF type:complete len:124 (-),score=4.24 TRINITY_DN2468_c0_g1_i1:4-375(-)